MSEALSSPGKVASYCDERYGVILTFDQAHSIIANHNMTQSTDKTTWLKYQLIQLGCFFTGNKSMKDVEVQDDSGELDELSCEIALANIPRVLRFTPGSDRRRNLREPGSSGEQYNGDVFTEVGI